MSDAPIPTVVVERATVALVCVAESDVPDSLDLDSLAEEVTGAAYTAAHEALAAVEGFRRYGDIGPDELSDLNALARLIVRSVLVNGRMSS